MPCRLSDSLRAWDTEAFAKTLKREIQGLSPGLLPLHSCTRQGGMVDESNISASILTLSSTEDTIQVKLAVFFQEQVGGCSCHDDPVKENAYGEIMVNIDKRTADASFSVLAD